MKENDIDEDQFDLKKLQVEASKDIDFFKKLSGMTERVKCFNQNFNNRMPKYQENFMRKINVQRLRKLQIRSVRKADRRKSPVTSSPANLDRGGLKRYLKVISENPPRIDGLKLRKDKNMLRCQSLPSKDGVQKEFLRMYESGHDPFTIINKKPQLSIPHAT